MISIRSIMRVVSAFMVVTSVNATCYQNGFQAYFNPSGGVFKFSDIFHVFDLVEWGTGHDYPPVSHGSTSVTNAVYISGPSVAIPLYTGTSAVAEFFTTTDLCPIDFQTCTNNVFIQVSVYNGDAFTITVNGMTLSTTSTIIKPVWVSTGSTSTLYMGASTSTHQVSSNGNIFLQKNVGDASGIPCIPTSGNTGTCYQSYMIPFNNWNCPTSHLPLTNNVNNVTIDVLRFSGIPSKNTFVCENQLNWKITRPCIGSTAIVGDPQFAGFRGQSYQIHGIDGQFYNLISGSDTQINSRFDFLTKGNCPLIDGKLQENCWSHPGSYLGAISVQQVIRDVVYQLEILAGPENVGFGTVVLDFQNLYVGDIFERDDLMINYLNSHTITVTTPEFSFTFENSDLFINQEVRVTVPLSEIREFHGLLGQTHSLKTYDTSLKYIEGKIDDYVLNDEDLMGVDFLYNRFSPPSRPYGPVLHSPHH